MIIKLLKESYSDLLNKDIYDTFDYAEFFKNNEKFKQSIPLYTEIINQVQKNIRYTPSHRWKGSCV